MHFNASRDLTSRGRFVAACCVSRQSDDARLLGSIDINAIVPQSSARFYLFFFLWFGRLSVDYSCGYLGQPAVCGGCRAAKCTPGGTKSQLAWAEGGYQISQYKGYRNPNLGTWWVRGVHFAASSCT
eukprot:scaffold39327_cov28-Cyclotella_meneghiniana.AAC.2